MKENLWSCILSWIVVPSFRFFLSFLNIFVLGFVCYLHFLTFGTLGTFISLLKKVICN